MIPNFNTASIANIAGAIVFVALVTTVVTSKQTADIIRATGRTFTDSIKAATGQ